MFKLGRKQLLGLLTAATVVVSTVGTFAVWDTLEATKTSTVSMEKPITVSVDEFTFGEATKTDNDISYESTVTIPAKSATGKNLQLTPTTNGGEGVTVKLEKAGSTADNFKEAAGVYTDSNINGNGDNQYKVTVTATKAAAESWTDVDKKDVTVTIAANLVASQTPAP